MYCNAFQCFGVNRSSSQILQRHKRNWIIDSFSINESYKGPFPYSLGTVSIYWKSQWPNMNIKRDERSWTDPLLLDSIDSSWEELHLFQAGGTRCQQRTEGFNTNQQIHRRAQCPRPCRPREIQESEGKTAFEIQEQYEKDVSMPQKPEYINVMCFKSQYLYLSDTVCETKYKLT